MTAPIRSTATATGGVLTGALYAGLIGYGAVVVMMAALNLLEGRSPFYTAALFGSALFYGLTDPATLVIAPGPVLAYNALHLIGFFGLGLVASGLVALSERYPAALYLILFPLILVAAHLFLALSMFAQPLLGAAGPWQLGASSLTAAVLMGWYLWRGHPVLRRQLRDTPLGDVPEES
jgi:hypothetical protein